MPDVDVAATVCVEPLDDTTAVRPLDPNVRDEAVLASASAAYRAAQIHRWTTLVDGIDLRHRAEHPGIDGLGHGRLTPAGWSTLDPIRAVDRLLATHHLGNEDRHPVRSRLTWTRDGVDQQRLPTADLLDPTVGGGPVRVAVGALADRVLDGLSAVVLGLDEVDDGVASFVSVLETIHGIRSSALVYLGGPGAVGWGRHFDDHDVLVAQVDGTKDWRVFAPTVEQPSRVVTGAATSAREVWRGRLHPGDVLFVPRGWGHEVTGTDTVSTHLTFPIRTRSIGDLVTMAARTARRDPMLRADVAVAGADLVAPLAHLANRPALASGLAYWRARVPARRAVGVADDRDLARRLDHGEALPPLAVHLPGGIVAVPTDRTTPVGTLAVAFAGRRVEVDATTAAVLAAAVVGRWRPDTDVERQVARALLDAGVLAVDRPAPGAPAAAVPAPEPPAPATRPVPPTTITVEALGGPGEVDPLSTHPWARRLANAKTTARRRAAERLRHDLVDLDLVDLLTGGGPRRPTVGRIEPTRWEHLDLASDLDGVLSTHDLRAQIRVAADRDPEHRPAPADLFVPPYAAYGLPRLDPAALRGLLARQHTIVVRDVDRSTPRLGAWLADLEVAAGRAVAANLYASHGPAPGFGAHWDDHDLLVVQVDGEKRWRLCPPIEPDPVRPHTPLDVTARWEHDHLLRAGDVLFVPRGWGHEVVGTDTGSRHLAVPVRDLRRALQLEHRVAVGATDPVRRADVASDPTPTADPFGSLPAEVADDDRVRLWWAARARPRIHPRLAVVQAVLAGTAEPATRVRLAAPVVAAGRNASDGERRVACGNRLVTFTPRHAPVLELLADQAPHPLAEATAPDGGAAVAALVRAGLIEVVTSASESAS